MKLLLALLVTIAGLSGCIVVPGRGYDDDGYYRHHRYPSYDGYWR